MSYNKETGMWEGYIYKITNKCNGKIYIGQTAQTIERRFTAHKFRAKNPKQYIHNAMHSYGVENFNVEEIEKVTSFIKNDLYKQLDILETYYINIFNTINPNGYNNSSGGRENDGYKEQERIVSQYSLNGELLKDYISLKEASDLTGFDKSGISKCCLGKIHSSNGFIWRYQDINLKTNSYKNCFIDDGSAVTLSGSHIVKKVNQYDECGNLIKTYNSALEAEIKSDHFFSRQGIQACCNGRTYTYKKYIWRYYNDSFDKYSSKIKKSSKEKPPNTKTSKERKYKNVPIDMYNSSLEYMFTYTDVYAIPNLTQSQINSVINCCKGKIIISQGRIWRFSNDDINKYKTSKNTWHEIAMLDENKNIIKIFKNAKLAADYIKGDRSCIIECCKGTTNRRRHKGYYWKYSETIY